MKGIASLLAAAIVVALSITLISSVASAQNSDDSSLSAPPAILIYKENESLPIDYFSAVPVIYADDGKATLIVHVRLPNGVYDAKALDTIMTSGGYLTSVSYKASWKNNQTVELNTSSYYDFNLTNIPYGNQHLVVHASCVFLILDSYSTGSTHPFYDSSEKSLDFTVAPTPTPSVLEFPSVANLPMLIAILSFAVEAIQKAQVVKKY